MHDGDRELGGVVLIHVVDINFTSKLGFFEERVKKTEMWKRSRLLPGTLSYLDAEMNTIIYTRNNIYFESR